MSALATLQPDVSNDIEEAFEYESEVRSYCRTFNKTFARASGSHIFDLTGRRYIDFLAGASSLNYGHNDPDMAKAAVRYIETGGLCQGLDFQTVAKAEFIQAFDDLILAPRSLDYRMQFTGPTGTNAVEAALKLARKVTGRHDVVAFTRGFHGMTLGALAATGNGHHRMAGTLRHSGITRAYFDGYFGPLIDTAEMLERLLEDPSSGIDPPAAILLETVQGEGGLSTASAAWMQRIAAIAQRFGALLIIDDIQAGCGRTGTFFSFEPLGISPDLVVLSKSLSGFGQPLAVVLIKPEYDRWLPGEHNGTFRGNNLAFVTARVALEKFWSNTRFTEDIARRSKVVQRALSEIAQLVPGARVKGRGMMMGVDLRNPKLSRAVIEKCFEDGLIIECSGPNDEVVKVLAPLTTSDDVLEYGLQILRRAVRANASLWEAEN